MRLKAVDEALAVFRQGCQLVPTTGLYIAYIDNLVEHNRTEEAIAAATEGLSLFPGNLLLHLKEALILPIVYETKGQVEYYRRRFSNRLAELENKLKLDTPEEREDAYAAVCGHVNFHLCYQMKDDRELQERYANFVHRILTARHPGLKAAPKTPRAARKGRIRLGYISTLFKNPGHAVVKTFSGWISNRNPEKFEVFLYSPQRSSDSVPGQIPKGCEHYRHLQGDLLDVWSKIRADDLDAAIFVDVGLARRTTALACLRVAPVQCVTWGHPITSGSPNVDFFLSSSLMEPPDADDYYSERLIRLPGLGVYYPKPVVPRTLDSRRKYFGLRDDSTVYLCCQSIFKYSPEHDDVFARIAKRVPTSQFVFLPGNADLEKDFWKRLDRAFIATGLRAATHCFLLPKAATPDYWALIMTSDIYLDSIGWSGFNTTMDAVSGGLPVVTLPGRFMRGRFSYAILKQLDMLETVARDKEDYIDIAVRLGLDSGWRKQLMRRMLERQSCLHSDESSVVALEEFLMDAISS